MSGRPKVFPPWASGAFPVLGKPWDSTAKRTANVNGYFTPGVGASAQEVNDAIGTLTDDANLLLTLCGQQAALNWSTIDGVPGAFTFRNAAWDNKWGRWFVYGASATSSISVNFSSSNGGRTFAAAGGVNPVTPSNQIISVVFNNAGNTGKCAVFTIAPSTDCTSLTDEEARFTTTSTTALAGGGVFNGLYIFGGRNNATTPLLQTSPLGTNSWTNRNPGVFVAPTTWGSATGYMVVASPTNVIHIALGVANYGEYLISTNGTTWTLGGHPFAAGWSNTGCCYASDRFILMQTNGTDSRVVYSLDGTNWFGAGTFTTTLFGGVAAIGSLIFTTSFVHADTRGAWSVDGGFTFQQGGQFGITPQTAGLPDIMVSSNGAQFAVVNTLKTSFSTFMAVPTG